MVCPGLQSSLRLLVRDAARARTREIPSFLVPAFAQRQTTTVRRNSTLASESSAPQSRIGRAPINVPPEVSLKFYDLPKTNARSRNPDAPTAAVEVTGPLGMW